MTRRLYFIGLGGSSWRDPRNWSREEGGKPLRHLHARGDDVVVIGHVDGHDELDLRGMPTAGVELRRYEGRLRLPDGGRVAFASPTGWRSAPLVPPGFRRALARAGGWRRAFRDGRASLTWTRRRGWLLVPALSGAASRQLFWVGGNATWNATAGTKWSLTSGGPSGEAIPTNIDDVHFDNASNVTVSLTTAAARSIDFTGYTGTFTHNAGVTITLGDPAGTAQSGNVALKLVAGMTYTLGSSSTSAWKYVGTSATAQTLTTGTQTLAGVTVDAVGGTLQLADSFTQNSAASVTLTNGTLNTNSQSCSWGAFAGSSANTKALTLGTTTVSLKQVGTVTVWNLNSAGTTLSAASATIQITSVDAGQIKTFAGGTGLTYGTITHTTTGGSTCNFSASITVATLTVTAATNSRTLTVNAGKTITVTSARTLTGTGGGTLTVDNDAATPSSTTFITLAAGGTDTRSNVSIVTADIQVTTFITPATASFPYESGKGVTATASDPYESAAGIAKSVAEPYETLSVLAVARALPYETLVAVRATSQLPYEALGGLALAAAFPYEALLVLRSTGAFPYEDLRALATTSASPYETLVGLAVDGRFPYEGGGGIAAISALPYEALGTLAAISVLPFETIARLAAAAALPYSSLAGLAQTVALPYEALLGLAASSGFPFEALAALALSASTPFETLEGLAERASLPYSTLAGLSKAANLVYEALAEVAATSGLPYETLATKTLVTATAVLVYETLQGVSAEAAMPYETLGERLARPGFVIGRIVADAAASSTVDQDAIAGGNVVQTSASEIADRPAGDPRV